MEKDLVNDEHIIQNLKNNSNQILKIKIKMIYCSKNRKFQIDRKV